MPEQISTADEMRGEPPVRREPIIAIPIDEIIAWIESWDTPHELPPPEARRVS